MGAPGLLKVSFWAPLWRPWASEGRLRATSGATGRRRDAHVCTDMLFRAKVTPPGTPKCLSAAWAVTLWRPGKAALGRLGRGFRVGKTTFQQNGVSAGPSKRD